MLCANGSSLMFMQGWNYVTWPLGKLGDWYPGTLSIPFAMLAAFVKCVVTKTLKSGRVGGGYPRRTKKKRKRNNMGWILTIPDER